MKADAMRYIKTLCYICLCSLFVFLSSLPLQAQKALYSDQFPLQDVRLLDGPFKRAFDLNVQTLLKYDMPRLLQPFYKQAGLDNGARAFGNWAGLDGHVGGHYLSALSIHYAASQDPYTRGLLKARIDSMIACLKTCQEAAVQLDPKMEHYLGGVPDSKNLWTRFAQGDFSIYNRTWVAWYNVHKMFAGLRDAWLYAGDSTALQMFFDYCDWALAITSGLSDAQMQTMLDIEHGGMNEVLADAYRLSGDLKYLNAAKRFTHRLFLDGMANENARFLDNRHANTQVPKFVGIQRIYELSPSLLNYAKAAEFFWKDVVYNRSLALGGNSRSEHFIAPSACGDYVTYREGPETCNTYNMLKLTENLFRLNQKAAYADFYEQALYNHILSTQHPEHGGYVYFTSARPRHYRVYSQVNQAMWCCVGSGMENHGKYNQFVYTHRGDSLYVNLFIPTELQWRDKGVVITQETAFPYETSSRLSIRIPGGGSRDFSLWLRHPYWADSSAYCLRINGEIVAHNSRPQTYVCISRSWHHGDVLSIDLPMKVHYKTLPNVNEYLALMYGPILLGANVSTDRLDGLLAAEGRMDHVAEGPLLPLNQAPVLVGNRDSLAQAVHLVDSATLSFEVTDFLKHNYDTTYQHLKLQPFYSLHDARYMMYWMQLRPDEYREIYDLLNREEQERLALEARTVDQIATGEQQHDQNHHVEGVNTGVGVYQNTYYREATQGGWFSYEMSTLGVDTLVLRATYWGYESGNRTFDILVEGDTIARENLVGKWNISEFRSVDYEIPVALTAGKSSIRVTFDALEGHV
ncbi:MAG TPA: glycoside hydrolase family 127 protein, partial [Bacteroidales bacterium]|nr:glycoside hydrolase family 127 protein [Bacteroidales bacterium]